MIYRYKKTLQEIYNEYLEEYRMTGVKPYPDKLLALLLFDEKEKYDPEHLVNGAFYKKYQNDIDKKIEKVTRDFELTKEDIIHFIELKGIYPTEEKYEYNKLWFVFSNGFTSLIGMQRFHPSYTKEKAYHESYNEFFGQYKKENKKTRKRTL